MVWKKVEIPANEIDKDHILLIQNSSIIPNSLVYISFTTASQADPDNAFMLTGPNQWEGRLKNGTNMFYAEEAGGNFTYTMLPVEKLENYDIPTQHVALKAAKQVIECPEGSYFVIQNKSTEPFSISIEGEGSFILTENQMLSFTFANTTNVTLHGTGQDAAYMIAEAPSLTQLSKEVQDQLDEMKTIFENFAETVLTRNEFREFLKKQDLTGKWSDIAESTGSVSISVLNDLDVNSDWLTDNVTLDVFHSVDYEINNVNKTAIIRYELIFKNNVTEVTLNNYYSDNADIRSALQNIVFKIKPAEPENQLPGQLAISLEFDPDQEINVINSRSKLRADKVRFLPNPTPTTTTTINIPVLRINEQIAFTNEEYYKTEILNRLDHRESDLFATTVKYEDEFTISGDATNFTMTNAAHTISVNYNYDNNKLIVKFPNINNLTRPILFIFTNTSDLDKTYTLNMLYSTKVSDIQIGTDTTCTYSMFEGSRFTKEIYKKFFQRIIDALPANVDNVYKLIIKY